MNKIASDLRRLAGALEELGDDEYDELDTLIEYVPYLLLEAAREIERLESESS